MDYPSIDDGGYFFLFAIISIVVKGMEFIETVVISSNSNEKWTKLINK
jgi:hypothetical protein